MHTQLISSKLDVKMSAADALLEKCSDGMRGMTGGAEQVLAHLQGDMMVLLLIRTLQQCLTLF